MVVEVSSANGFDGCLLTVENCEEGIGVLIGDSKCCEPDK